MYRRSSAAAYLLPVAVVSLVALVWYRDTRTTAAYRAALWRADSVTAALVTLDSVATARQRETDRLTAVAVATRNRAVERVVITRRVTDTLRLVAADTGASADTLRGALTLAVVALDSVTAVADGLVVALDSVTVAHAEERRAWQSWVAGVDTALAAERALRVQSNCRIWRFPCPSRRQSAVLAALATLVFVR